jgi:hypothetical protein
LSLAVLLLIGDAAARRHHRSNLVQFTDDDDLSGTADQSATEQTLHEVEKQMGATMKVDADTQKMAIKDNTKLSFNGDDFSKAQLTFGESSMIQIPVAQHIPGVTLIQELSTSDPIHGSLGEPKIKMEDLTPEQQFEEGQRRKKP